MTSSHSTTRSVDQDKVVSRQKSGLPRLSRASKAVIKILETEPEITPQRLAILLGVDLEAAKKRTQRLLRSGVLSRRLVVAPQYSCLSARAVVSMRIDQNSLRRKAKPEYRDLRTFTRWLRIDLPKTSQWAEFFRSQPEPVVIRSAFAVAGGGIGIDLIVVVEGATDLLVREFVTSVLGRLPGVSETNTAAVTYSGA